jgi:hypothetical protein
MAKERISMREVLLVDARLLDLHLLLAGKRPEVEVVFVPIVLKKSGLPAA